MSSLSKNTAVFLVAILAISTLAAAGTYSVDVKVIDKHGDPIDDMWVYFENADQDPPNETDEKKTDDDGEANNLELDDDYEDWDILIAEDLDHPDDGDDFESLIDDEYIRGLDDDETYCIVMRPKLVDIEITVVDENGDEVEDATVEIKSLDEDYTEEDQEDDCGDYDPVDDYEAFEIDDDDDEDETNSKGEVEFKDVESDTSYEVTISKSGHKDVTVIITPDLGEDWKDDIELIEPGTAKFTVIVKVDGSTAVIEGATVTLVNRDSLEQDTKTTNADGKAVFTLDSPECYDMLITKERHSDRSQTDLCFQNNDDETTTYFLVAQNNPPVANAGPDANIMEGGTANLDGTGSSDPDGDPITYAWAGTGLVIDPVAQPVLTFNTPGTYPITLTVSDGQETSTDTMNVNVEAFANCGNEVCSAAEDLSGTCPEDCPVCLDEICALGENEAESPAYCPVDCGIAISVILGNTSPIVIGNLTPIIAVDPFLWERVGYASFMVELPNGTLVGMESAADGEVLLNFSLAGRYNITAVAEIYDGSSIIIEIGGGGFDGGILLWILLIVVIAIVVLFLVKLMNEKRRSGGGWSKSGKYKRRKSSLSSV